MMMRMVIVKRTGYLLDGCVSITASSIVRDLGEKNDNPIKTIQKKGK
jgi:hypothetical protein